MNRLTLKYVVVALLLLFASSSGKARHSASMFCGTCSGNEAARLTSTVITPVAFEVTRGTLAFGTVVDLAASDNVDVSVRRNISDIQSVVEVVTYGNSVNAFPTGIDITIESAVFARSAVIQEIHAFNFTTNSFELVDSRPASRFLDRVDTVSLSGDLTRFVTPAAGNLSLMVRFVSPNNRQQFTANVDQTIWTIFE